MGLTVKQIFLKEGINNIPLPSEYEITSTGMSGYGPCIWIKLDPDQPVKTKKTYLLGPRKYSSIPRVDIDGCNVYDLSESSEITKKIELHEIALRNEEKRLEDIDAVLRKLSDEFINFDRNTERKSKEYLDKIDKLIQSSLSAKEYINNQQQILEAL